MRVGPFRLTASKLVSSSRVRNAAFASFLLAGVRDFPRVEDLVVAGRDRRHGDLGRMVLHRGRDRTGTSASVNCSCLSTSALWRRSAPPTSNTSPCESVVVAGRRDGLSWRVAARSEQLARRRRRSILRQEDVGRANESWTRAVLFATCVLGVLVAIAGRTRRGRHRGDPALHSCGPPGVLEQERTRVLPMLKYSARAQLQLGALLAVVLVFRIGL